MPNTGPPLYATAPDPERPPTPVTEAFNWNTLFQRVFQAVITAVGVYLAALAAK